MEEKDQTTKRLLCAKDLLEMAEEADWCEEDVIPGLACRVVEPLA